ncbi:hypothetical protein ACB094_12G045600 [Castanea mollissima]
MDNTDAIPIYIPFPLHHWPLGVRVGDAKNITCPERERQALLKFKKALVDDYGRLSSWRSKDKNCCNWKGVHCSNQTGHALELHLSGKHIKADQPLRGMISPSLLELSDLNFLDHGDNDFTQNNLLEFIGSLKYLALASLNLSVRFSSLFGFNYWKSLTSLESLNLDTNKLVSLPKSIGNACTLSKLLPKEEKKKKTKPNTNQALSLSPPPLIHLYRCAKESLEDLGLSNNQLTGSLPNFAIFPSLKYLDLSFNILNGTVPKSIGNLYKLEYLDMSWNFPQGTISEPHFSDLSKLLHLDLSNNSLALEFNFNWVPSFQLVQIYLTLNASILKISNAEISDTIPIEWFADLPPTLEFLDLSRNRIHGQLPNHELVALNFAGNKFSGEDPNSLGRLSNLETLKLYNNSFSGKLPSSLKNCSSLIVIDLGDNRFFGEVPAWIGEGLPWLIVLILPSNKFDGSIPLNLYIDSSSDYITSLDYFSYLGNYTSLIIYVDNVTVVSKGREDEYTKNLGLLIMINLSGNKLIGNLPIEISSLLELVTLNVSGKNLSGEIPHLIGQLKKLETLDLSKNQFSGEIRSSMSELSFLNHLDLSYNHLCGKIPSSTQLQSFKASDFAGNQALWGLPLSRKCWPGEQTPNQSGDGEEYRDEFWKWFYGAAGFGFVVGFLGVCGSLLLKN